MAKTKREIHKELEVIAFATQKPFMTWLKKHHEQQQGIWIKFGKKNSGIKSITYEEAREAAIIYGWIDGLINKYEPDGNFYLTKFTQRRPRSKWSKINVGIATELIETGKMMPSGLLQVEAAKADGRWDAAYDSQTTIEVPPELRKKLAKFPKAKKFFDSISKANRYAFLYRIHNAKREVTRQKHIDKTIEMLLEGKVYHPKR